MALPFPFGSGSSRPSSMCVSASSSASSWSRCASLVFGSPCHAYVESARSTSSAFRRMTNAKPLKGPPPFGSPMPLFGPPQLRANACACEFWAPSSGSSSSRARDLDVGSKSGGRINRCTGDARAEETKRERERSCDVVAANGMFSCRVEV